MNQKELKELIEFLVEKDISEFELERGDVKVRVKRAGEHVTASGPAIPIPHAGPAASAARHVRAWSAHLPRHASRPHGDARCRQPRDRPAA